jgi:hypothetical protein
MISHTCDNDICKLLNPCVEELLPYQEVIRRVAKVEEYMYAKFRKIKKKEMISISEPLDFLSWANRHMIYQLPSKEFISELSKKIRHIEAGTILEIGAGRGIISKHVGKMLNRNIILTDSYDWWKYGDREKIIYQDILERAYIDAIEEFKPDLIIASWIPYNVCWTKDFRKYPFVKGYIIIGERRGGATGSEEDWGVDWNMQHLEDVNKYGICRTDHGFCMKDHMFCIKHTSVAYFERPQR